MNSILPPSTIGLIGNGPFVRSSATAAKALGFTVVTFGPQPTNVADSHITASYDDISALARLADQSDVVAYELENADPAIVQQWEKLVPVFPSSRILRLTQHRIEEKEFIQSIGLPTAAFEPVNRKTGIIAAQQRIGYPAIIKRCRLAPEQKDQRRVETATQAQMAIGDLGGEDLIWEQLIDVERELSIVGARGSDGSIVIWPIALPAAFQERALEIFRSIVTQLDVIGIFSVELFFLADGQLMVNKLIPGIRIAGSQAVHNNTPSPFGNHIRAICGLPFEPTTSYQD
ncbi:ATP-grasp domain-containing protein [Candidatus Uhrbacteria bacterium]|nr:ATP-grasp domain-containing protein [Candidatus Uhrbacteria bacterium]